ncbi:pentapeptide repeat-containing protein [Flavobacterium undicola]|uniref:pentapeptide repeat-containing protein n=1 Tax=Flavobacterium undicola TaxID=1932779 RepID=UPI001378F32F|nr:pentapeptide repeat-containing protein [Flavobacterium undicola]MBA0883047.1 pentapeptide repeat-containing protein [Flavobacterium undicola]
MKEINTLEEFKNNIKNRHDGFTNVQLNNCVINVEVIIDYPLGVILVDNCIFNKPLKINQHIGENANFSNCKFKSDVSFSNCKFIKKVRFYSSHFEKKVEFRNTVFNDLADFWGVIFFQKTIFYKTDFLKTTVFSTTVFKENVLFTYSLIEKLIIFRGTKFNKGLDLSVAIISGTISPFDITIANFKCNPDTQDEGLYEDYVSSEGIIVEKNKRETFRILKKHFIDQSNSIDYLKYSTFEQETYYHQLKKKVFRKNPEKDSIQNFIILILNYISNNHGKSYLRAILFTFSIGLIFFYFSLIATENYYFSLQNMTKEAFFESIKYYFNFMTPTHKIEYLENEKPKTFFYIWDFFGRAFVSYGIFQTIQAFRKFKK